jgi:hypothetical protein
MVKNLQEVIVDLLILTHNNTTRWADDINSDVLEKTEALV